MSYKKQILTIITLVVLLLLTMSTTIQAASVGKVYGLEANMNGSQIKLTWDSVSGAAGYNVYANGTKVGSINTNEASLIGFSEGTTYRFKVAAYDYQGREGTISSEAKLTTNIQETLGKVKNLKVTQVNGYVTLNWSSVSKANKYQVFVDIPNFGEVNIGEVTTTNVTIKGFIDNLRYGFSIRACQTLSNGKINVGEKATYQYCTVDYDKDDTDYNDDSDDYEIEVGRISNVSVYDITDTRATVSWSKVSNADGYEVLLSKNNGTYKNIKDTTNTSVTLYNLSEDSYYKVKVVAYKWIKGNKIYGEESSYEPFTTDKEEKYYTVGQVKNVYIDSIGKNSVDISWSKVNDATGYNIYIAKNNSKDFRYEGTTSYRDYTITGLDANTNYQVKVEAYKTVNGKEYEGEKSIAKSFTTKKSSSSTSTNTQTTTNKLEKVTHLNVTVKNRNEAYLSWWPVDDADGYDVYISKEGGEYKLATEAPDNNCILYSWYLDYYTSYSVKVRAYEYNSRGEKVYSVYYSSPKNFVTQKYNKTENSSEVGIVKSVDPKVKGIAVDLYWSKIYGAEGYEIDFTVPGMVGSTKILSSTNYTTISGLTDKKYNYTARVRAYKTINGTRYYGPYSDVVKFKGE